jgi:solute carrier family 50 protein (sugar transporter)
MAQITSSLGMFASIISIILSASPLFTIQQVVSTRNSSSILGSLTMAQVVNALLWSMYGLAIRNAFVYGPNLIGLGLGLAQLALKITFPSKQS